MEKISYLSGDFFQLLNPIFSQVGKTQMYDLFYSLDIGGFGYNDKLYLIGISAGTHTSGVDGVFYLFYSCNNFCHKTRVMN